MPSNTPKVAIVGAGWFGCHVALELASSNYEVYLFEKESCLFGGVSGKFGIRIHRGPHYPRSSRTRESCRTNFDKFCAAYPEVVVPLGKSIYAYGTSDSHGRHSKATLDEFDQSCLETGVFEEISPMSSGLSEVLAAYQLHEPCAILNPRLRDYFSTRLADAGVRIHLETEIERLQQCQAGVRVDFHDESMFFFKVINATGYSSLISPDIARVTPVKMDVVYQTCIALEYIDMNPEGKPVSFIVMDGWFPCLMPAVGDSGPKHRYVVTHGYYTILGSFQTPREGEDLLSKLDSDFISQRIRPVVEKEMSIFWPEFLTRFRYVGWKGTVLAKLKTEGEFRSSVVFERDEVIYIFPGKISEVIDAGEQVMSLMERDNCAETSGFHYPRNGTLNKGREEIEEAPKIAELNTCCLQAYQDLAV